MTHHDLLYTIWQLEHQELQAKLAGYRIARECTRQRAAARRAWLARLLRRLSMRRLRGVAVTQ